jgi:Galactose mutarotase and related enzymes
MSITKRSFGNTGDGTEVYIFTLKNCNGMTAEITNFGGIVARLFVPAKDGKLDDVVLGYDNLNGYLKHGPYFGAIVGRHANRIEDAKFEINGVEYRLNANDGKNHLHGGLKGFDKAIWQPEVIEKDSNESLQLTYRSRDGEENYPGNLDVKVIYTLTDENALNIDYFAVSDKDTVVNLTNHSYFNLSGHKSGNISNHKLMINADEFTPINSECIPTGEIRSVKGTPMDFTTLSLIGPGLESGYKQIDCGHGYDHNWVLNGEGLKKAAEVVDENSGRVMEVYTTMPGVQFYSGNFLEETEGCKDGAVYRKRAGLCLETQYFPNALKHRDFPSPILRAGELYRHTTVYKFLVR